MDDLKDSGTLQYDFIFNFMQFVGKLDKITGLPLHFWVCPNPRSATEQCQLTFMLWFLKIDWLILVMRNTFFKKKIEGHKPFL